LIKRNKLQKKYELIKEGEKIKFIYLKEPNMIQSNIIAFPNVIPTELDLHKYIDFDMQYEKSFVEPLKIVLDSIGWKTEHVSSLADFFA
jgi:DNA polymerase elongation subunit (family B)